MWRDRTNLYVSYRQSYAHHPSKRSRYSDYPSGNGFDARSSAEEQRGLISSGAFADSNDAVIEMDRLPPRWFDIADEVTDLLDSISQNMTKLDPMHSKHVLPGFEDEAVKRREEREIEKLTQDITKAFQGCQRAVKRIEAMVKEDKRNPDGAISLAEETLARNLQVSLATKVGDVSAVFRKKQSNYLKKLRSLSGMGSPLDRSSTPIQGNPYADPSLMESMQSMEDRSFSQSTLQQTAQKRRPGMETAILQREKEIEDIAQGIIELANIFQELQTMVIDQGTMLDRIDYNVERMTVDVKAADKELTTATGYQKRTTKRKIILLLILIVAGLIILLMIKPKRSSSESPIPVEEMPPGIPAQRPPWAKIRKPEVIHVSPPP